jgi:Mitochondrial import 2
MGLRDTTANCQCVYSIRPLSDFPLLPYLARRSIRPKMSTSPSRSPTSPLRDSDLDSLPSSLDSSDYEDVDGEELESDAEQQWKESLQQMELLLTMVAIPFVGKYMGRKCAYWGESLS